MYIYLQYHGKYTKDIGTTVYILNSFLRRLILAYMSLR